MIRGRGWRAAPLSAAVALALTIGFATDATNASPSDAFDQITYRDTGGFAGGGRGISLTVTGSGNLEAKVPNSPPRIGVLQGQELAELHSAVAVVDWPHVERNYLTPGAADLVIRNLTIVIRGQTFETHAMIWRRFRRHSGSSSGDWMRAIAGRSNDRNERNVEPRSI
jgi:hypothetical protein